MKRLLILACLGLTACGTPQEQCISRNTRDLRIVEDLIAEAELNLARGYAMETRTVYTPRWTHCGPPIIRQAKDGRPARVYPPRMCFDHVPQTVREPQAIDLRAEAAKLSGLRTKQAQLSRQASGVVAQCRELYPEA